MNIQQAKEEIIHTVKIYTEKNEEGQYVIPAVHQRPVLLMGPPGIGKTAIISQAAEECGVALVAYTITHHTRQSAVGLPVVITKEYGGKTVSVTEYTMSEIIASVYEAIEQTGIQEGILFIDEINCVSETLTPTILQFLQNKTFGTHKVPAGWIIAAAGNPPEYNRSARIFDIVTMDRVKNIVIEEDFPVWKAYALQRNVHGAILSYLSSKTQNFYYIEDARGDREFVTARGWEDLSVFLQAYERMNVPVTADMIREYIHAEKIALDFFGYYMTYLNYRQTYTMDRVLDGTLAGEELSAQKKLLAGAPPDECYSVIQMLLDGLALQIRGHEEKIRLETRKNEIFAQIRDLASRETHGGCDELLGGFLEKFERSVRLKDEHRIITEKDRKTEEKAAYYFSSEQYRLRSMGIREAGAGLDELEKHLALQKDVLFAEADSISDALERAVSFLEDSLGRGEMLGYFLTSLAMDPDAASFLSDHPSGAVLRNRALLETADEEYALQRQIEALRAEDEKQDPAEEA